MQRSPGWDESSIRLTLFCPGVAKVRNLSIVDSLTLDLTISSLYERNGVVIWKVGRLVLEEAMLKNRALIEGKYSWITCSAMRWSKTRLNK